ncbi:PAS domain-containing hybrid sensor histidine kinase/response regulator [Pontibacter anaerobius]|uniref:histidine kinase n=1 Tax=Pontibacter anaerobius TaxID=2993940 RepID=A0ABT3RCQ8_9BACT|nr:PAS domain S-box protein [Pontibacter anaerobius]MCX2739221.1 PAS domain S-box protein [Pontibacter anaerobius]
MISKNELLQQLEEERSARKAAEELAQARFLELQKLQEQLKHQSNNRDKVAEPAPENKWIKLQAEVQHEYPNPVLRLGYDGEIRFANAAAEALVYGITQPRLEGLKRLLLMHIRHIEKIQGHKPASFDTCIASRHYHVLFYPAPHKAYFNIYMTDFTEQRNAESALRESQKLLRNIALTIPNIVYIYEIEEDTCIYINDQIQHLLGYNKRDLEKMEGQIFSQIVVPEQRSKVQEHTQRMKGAQDGEVVDIEYLVQTKEGSIKNLFCRESVFKRKDNGQVQLIIGSAEDVTQVRQQSYELLRQKEFYEAILNHIPSDVAVYNSNLQYLYVNPAAVGDNDVRSWIVGKTNEDYSILRNVPPNRMKSRTLNLHRVLEAKARVEFEERLVDRNGNESYHIRRLNPVLNQQGEVELIIGHGLNITELRLAQEEIIASEAKNRAILTAIPDLMFIIDKQGDYLDMKNGAQIHLLVPKENVVGNNIYNLLPSDLATTFMKLIAKVITTGQYESIDYSLELPEGLRHYEGRILKYSEDEVLTIIRDMTEEKQAALQVKEKNEFIRQVLDASSSLIYVKDAEGKLVLANQEFAKLFGKTLHDVLGNRSLDVHHNKDEAEFYLDIDRQVIQDLREIRVQERHTSIHGETLWFNTVKKPLITSDGKVNVLGISTNITEQRVANKRLKDSEELHRLLSENSKDMVSLHNLDGSYVYVSKAVEEILGYTQEELVQLKPEVIIHPDDINKIKEQVYREALQQKHNTTLQHRLIRKDDREIWVETNIRPILNEQGEPVKFQSAARNISQRRKSEEALKNSEKRYRDLINYSPAFICTHDLNGVIQSVNPYLLNMLGYTADEMIGHSLLDFFPKESEENFAAYLRQFGSMNLVDGILTILNKEKDVRYLYYKNYKVEEPNLAPYIIAIAQDITDRLRTEQELTRAKEAAEESARVKENFMANMSHEIRTPMNGILGMASLMRKTELDEAQQNYLNIIRQSAENLLVIINDILDIAKIEAGKLELEEIPFNLKETIQLAFQTFIYKAEEKEIGYVLQPLQLEHPMVIGDPYRLNQVLLNLLSNAIKFTEEGNVTLSCQVLDEEEDKLTIGVSVADTGIGIPPSKVDYIFEGFSQAYSSTTRKYGGTGLGLSISKTLIEMQHGRIWVESKEKNGSTFKFILSYQKSEEEIPVMQEEEIDYGSLGPLQVLLAEDNEINIFLAQSILEGWGMKVHVARNGREAVELVARHKYDVVLMDIQMPELSGIDATAEIRSLPDKANAEVPIIALTANALKGDAEKYLAAGMNDYISKPFEEDKLFMKLAALVPHKKKLSESQAVAEHTTAQPVAEPLFDLTLLHKISRGNEAFITRTKQLFIQSVPATVAEMQQKLHEAEWAGVSAAAHKLKSTIDTMRIEKLRDVVRNIESNAKSEENLQDIKADVEVLATVMEQVVKQLQTDLV